MIYFKALVLHNNHKTKILLHLDSHLIMIPKREIPTAQGSFTCQPQLCWSKMGANHLVFQDSNVQGMWQNLAPKGIHPRLRLLQHRDTQTNVQNSINHVVQLVDSSKIQFKRLHNCFVLVLKFLPFFPINPTL